MYLFALGAWLGIALANLGTGLMLLATALDGPRVWRRLRGGPWPWLLAASGLTLLASLALAWRDGPADWAKHSEDTGKLFRLWGFLLVAWWCGGQARRVWIALALALAGFTLGRLAHLDELNLAPALDPALRTGFGMPILAFGQYVAMALLALCLLAPRLWHAGTGLVRGFLALAWLLLVLLAVQGLLISQARGVWGVTLLLLPALLWLQWREFALAHGWSWRRALPVLALAGAMLALVVALNAGVIAGRFAQEADSYRHLLAGEWGQLDYGSIGIRVRAWIYGFDAWLERPWFGWGPGSATALLQASPDAGLRGLNDFHNMYLELPVRIGLLGALPFAVGAVLVLRALWHARRRALVPRDLYLILLGALALHFLASLTNMRALNFDWRFYWMLFAGAACTFALHPPAQAGRDSSSV